MKKRKRAVNTGRLRIGDNWNAITIIALSQSNPMKAIAEFVENSIDAHAQNITIIRGRKKGSNYLKIIDDGEGIPKNSEGVPDFRYVATHICDSIKRRMKREGAGGIQGEFGIGLLSFWTVGEELCMVSSSDDGRTFEMKMRKGSPGYTITRKRTLIPLRGTELTVSPLLPGVRSLSGERIQRYLASELRDRIRKNRVSIRIIDRTARKQLLVEPREFSGRLLHRLPQPETSLGEIYVELYLNESSSENIVGLYRAGTRVLHSISELDRFAAEPWTSGWLEGIIDVPFLNLTPGTRSGVIRDSNFAAFAEAIRPLEERLIEIIQEQKQAEEERASRKILKTVQKALREAILSLPKEEYDWFDIHTGSGKRQKPPAEAEQSMNSATAAEKTGILSSPQKEFFEFAGPLYSVRISPASSVVSVNSKKTFRAVAMDKRRRHVEEGVFFSWKIKEGEGRIENPDQEIVTYQAPPDPALVTLEVTVTQDAVSVTGEALVTVTDTILPKDEGGTKPGKGLPGYTFRRAPGELWRSKYDERQNVIIINNGHRDFVYASKNRMRKLRYICRLFAKELVFRNFPGLPADQLLERMIELGLYTEEHLKG
jgi:signal transduction histidine kinase